MRVVDAGPITRSAPESHRAVYTFPALLACQDGSLLLTCRRVSDKDCADEWVELYRSNDGGGAGRAWRAISRRRAPTPLLDASGEGPGMGVVVAPSSWSLTQADHEFIARDIEPFLPDRIFDAHAHLFCHEHFDPLPAGYRNMPARLDLASYYRFINWIHPGGRTRGGLFFGLAFSGDRERNNHFVAEEVGKSPLDRNFGQMIISPDMSAESIYEGVKAGGFVGLKPYHTLAAGFERTWTAPIEAYLPEPQVAVAGELGLSITLHIVRDRALADPQNQTTIRRYCENYPDMRLILAHAGRGFNPWHTIEGIHSLRGLDNVFFDTSAVTEAGAFEAIIDVMGHERLLYGSDFPVSHLRGRCVAIGDSFHWIYADEMKLAEKHAELLPVLVGLESLRALRLACWRTRLGDGQIEDVFYNNANQLFARQA